MPNAMLTIHHEPCLDVNPCPLCGGRSGEPISERVAGGHRIDTQCCHHCAAVYQPVSWTSEELHAAYEAEHTGETETLVLPIPQGSMRVGDEFFDRVKSALLSGRANNAIALSYMQPGDRVMQLGCGAGETLVAQREALGVDCFGVECSERLAAMAEDNRIEVQLTSLDSPDFDFENLDEIQAFHFLQRVPDPLLWLQRCWDSLAVGGRIVVEVPNLYHPQGPLGDVFFRPTHLHSWSESTLTALLRRAGFVVERVVSTLTLFAVGRKESSDARDIAFSPELSSHPEHDSGWVVSRLRNYDAMEKTHAAIRRDGPDMERMHQLVNQLMQPAFEYHVVHVTLDLVDFFLSHRAVGLACLVSTAASEGPYPRDLTERFAKLAEVIREEGVAAVGLPSNEQPPATETLRQHTDRQSAQRSTPPRRKLVAAVMDEMRRDFSGKTALGGSPQPPFASSVHEVHA